MSYAFEDGSTHDIVVHLRIEDDFLVVEMEDEGIPFNPLEYTPHNLHSPPSERDEGGLGIHFCKQMTAEFCYEREENKNRIIFKKEIRNPGPMKKIFSCRRSHGNH